MTLKKMLEDYPLYRKFQTEVPESLDNLHMPAIHAFCENEKSSQTFNSVRAFYEKQLRGDNQPAKNQVLHVEYVCTSCKAYSRHFLIQTDVAGKWVLKAGQVPPWDVSLDLVLEKSLGDASSFYKRALICESQAYGIGAFAYYRRIVEEIIDSLLEDISDLIPMDERSIYLEALEQAKKTRVTQEKIELVRDLLPSILRPDGHNPLAVLHDTLSQGIHRESDETCMELAQTTREVLVFLVNQVSATKRAGSSFTESMRKLLDRKKDKGA
ncbi:MAG: hypothetical protein HYU84_17955 [Chloroflexi bacterium]|nr:hypothetical protein [Chloroflexota bacterium]MBI3158844.1 hypothetical protein [Chloroflexota bacterium]